MPSPLTVVHLSATGDYSYHVPQCLLDALVDEIESHMKAYGLTKIVVVAHATSAEGKQDAR